ncbi:HEAT repeat-containing protein 3-like [Haliotis rufescens]|uniref:HEAT repeat-containing protein 3-like n=1 Tax=Haliotis rufescens TaxID=6454 RepID=UPI00201F1223|nr:HEAT repeat-containing protein 3-like [Haliotis rufescens]
MGKSKKKKFRAAKAEPTGLTSVKEIETEIENFVPNAHGTVSDVIEQLQSVNVETRECGCSTLANLVSQPEVIPLLLQHNIVKIVAPLIVDPSPHIRHVSLGALRNLSVSGGHEVCEEMVQKDVLTPLVLLFQKYGVGWLPDKKEKIVKHDDTSENIFAEAVHLLWNICESSDLAVSVFNRETLVQYLLPCLQHQLYGFSTAIAVAQCLHAVTENNKMAAEYCQTGGTLALLSQLMTPVESADSIQLSTLVTGILINVSNPLQPQTPMATLVHTLATVLAVDVTNLIGEATQNGCLNGAGSSDEASIAHQRGAEPRGKLKEVDQILSAQQTSLEIIANLCCAGDDDWEDVSIDSGSSDEMAVDISMGEDASEECSPLCVPTEIQGALLNNDILTKVLNKAQPVEESKQLVLNNCVGGKKIANSLLRVQTHALLCVNNILNTMSADAMGGLLPLHKMWDGLVQLSNSTQAKSHLDLLEAVTSAMRAVMQKLAQLQSPKFSEITIADLQFLFALSHQDGNANVRVNAVRCVATIGGLLAKLSSPHPLLKDIGHFLLEVIGRDPELWVVAEALDSVFDVFAEDHIDPIVREIALVEKLRNFRPMLTSRINSERGRLGEHQALISMVRTNLKRFIDYKASR